VNEDPASERIAVIWSPEGRAGLRAIDRTTALQILHCIDRYLADRTGEVKKLKPPFTGFRLRCGDYRVFFDPKIRECHRDHQRTAPQGGLPLNASGRASVSAMQKTLLSRSLPQNLVCYIRHGAHLEHIVHAQQVRSAQDRRRGRGGGGD
jgi:mRNA-degrading endonuclease RelE of RelBE toxin-antitoxin system